MNNAELTCDQFQRLWVGTERENSFSNEGLSHLYDHLTNGEYPDIDISDIVALDCMFSEYTDLTALVEDYSAVCTDMVRLEDGTYDAEDIGQALSEVTTVIYVSDQCILFNMGF